MREKWHFEWFGVQLDTPLPNILHPRPLDGLLSFSFRCFYRPASRNGKQHYKREVMWDLKRHPELTKTPLLDSELLQHQNASFYSQNSYFTEKWHSALLPPLEKSQNWKRAVFPKELHLKRGCFVREIQLSSFWSLGARFWDFVWRSELEGRLMVVWRRLLGVVWGVWVR